MAQDRRHPLLIHVTTMPETFTFFRGQIAFLREQGFVVQAVSSPGPLLEATAAREQIPVSAVPMSRQITPWADLASLGCLYGIFRREKPAIVHAHTPKAWLLGTLAARLAYVPVVVYGMRGLPFVTAQGLKRQILILTEKIACALADRVIAVSQANRRTALNAGICPPGKIVVLANGSSNGVDATGRFQPQRFSPETRAELRQRYQIPPDAVVVGFVGRIVRDKGIVELAQAWQWLRSRYPQLYLLLIGPREPQDPVPESIILEMQADPRVVFAGQCPDPAPFYTAMDILVLPTHREGFPNTPLEAAAMNLPVVTTTVDGCPEAVADGVTGILVPPYDSQALAQALATLVNSPELREKLGQAGRQRVLAQFQPQLIWQALADEYQQLLAAKTGHQGKLRFCSRNAG
ncbi:MAG: glycosyltransferase family 4 protein [Desulfobacca sp.]|uniref:glycosyltransferase family 4 protein n=1 Tax=Desulfobacca sp. TaxID=2067990 RepID=UPI00404A1361